MSKSRHRAPFFLQLGLRGTDVFCVLFALLKVLLTIFIADVSRKTTFVTAIGSFFFCNSEFQCFDFGCHCYFLIFFPHLWPFCTFRDIFTSDLIRLVLLQPESHYCRYDVLIQAAYTAVLEGGSCAIQDLFQQCNLTFNKIV